MGNFRLFFSSVLFFVMISGCAPCDDDSGTSNDNYFTQNFGSEVSRDFIGQVVDQNGRPIQNAEVKIGTATTQTDVNGVFIINRANVYTRFAYITAKKDGFIDGSRAMVPTSGKNNVKIMLISNAPVQTISSGVASEVTLPNGTKVTFDGAFQDESGNAYSGSVQVAMFHLEASNENLSSLMPGMLYAKDSNGQEKVLETYGMLNVELKGSNGQKLQIASRHTAQITMPIDPTQLASAPNTIPLWHFDEEKGYWIEEWSATRVGNNYVGNVSHFSWWNCDAPFPTVSLTVNVTDSNGNPLPYIGVGLIRNNSTPNIAQTDNNGQVSGLIPLNEVLQIKLFDLCGNVIYTSTIGPFSSNSIIDIVLDNNVVLTTVTGNLVKCDGTRVTNGYVKLVNGNQTLICDIVNGSFNFQTAVCGSNNTFDLVGYNIEDMQTTGNLNYTFSSAVTNVGDIPACNSITEFISYRIGNDPVYWVSNNITTPATGTYPLHIYSTGLPLPSIEIKGQHTEIGVYSPSNTSPGEIRVDLSRYISPGTYNTYSYINSPLYPDTSLELKINNYGAVGEYIDITFSGNRYYPTTNTNEPISGVVHIIRDN